MQIFVSFSCLLLSVSCSWATAVEPPFSQIIVEIINERSVLPSLINTTLLLASIPPATLDAFLATAQNTNNTLPNPIATTFFNLTTGVINETLTVLPLDYTTARRIIPSQYGILTQSIHAVLPGFPADKYPVRDPIASHISVADQTIHSSCFPHKTTTASQPMGSPHRISP